MNFSRWRPKKHLLHVDFSIVLVYQIDATKELAYLNPSLVGISLTLKPISPVLSQPGLEPAMADLPKPKIKQLLKSIFAMGISFFAHVRHLHYAK